MPLYKEEIKAELLAEIGQVVQTEVPTPYKEAIFGCGEIHWAVKEIERIAKAGIMVGHQDGTFRPDEPVTRAQLAVIMDRALRFLGGKEK